MVGFGTFDRAIAVLEKHLQKYSFICGDKFTAADVYVGSHVIWGLQFKTLPSLSTFESYQNRLVERAAYQRSKKINDEKLASDK